MEYKEPVPPRLTGEQLKILRNRAEEDSKAIARYVRREQAIDKLVEITNKSREEIGLELDKRQEFYNCLSKIIKAHD